MKITIKIKKGNLTHLLCHNDYFKLVDYFNDRGQKSCQNLDRMSFQLFSLVVSCSKLCRFIIYSVQVVEI